MDTTPAKLWIKFSVRGDWESLEMVDPIKNIQDIKDAIKEWDHKRNEMEKVLEEIPLSDVTLRAGKDIDNDNKKIIPTHAYQSLETVLKGLDITVSDDESILEKFLKTVWVFVDLPEQGGQQPGPSYSPSSHLSLDELKAAFNEIEQEFYSGDWNKFIKAYVAGGISLPVTDGVISGLPRVWRRNDDQKGITTKPTLLFADLPNSVDSPGTRPNSTAATALEMISEKNFSFFPIFGASGCGKTRTVMDMLSQTWGFYFNGGNNDRGSDDVSTLVSILSKKIGSSPLKNNNIAKSITSCLLLARVSILSHCLVAFNGSMTPSQWMLLQVCPQVFGEVYWKDPEPSRTDLFQAFFGQLANSFSDADFDVLEKLLQDKFRNLKMVLTEQYRSSSKFLLVLDEAQTLGSTLEGEFRSERDEATITRPLLSPFYHGLEKISGDLSQYCVVFCGTGFCVYDLDWVWGTGEASKSNSPIEDHVIFRRSSPFPRWDDRAKVESYFNQLGIYLSNRGYPRSATALAELADQHVFSMLFARFYGRLRPIVTVIEDVIQQGTSERWKGAIKGQVERLTKTSFNVSGNLCFELRRILDRTGGHKGVDTKSKADIREILRNAVKKRLLYYKDFKLDYAEPVLVEASFARIDTDKFGRACTIVDEPIAFQAAINFFENDDPGLHDLLKREFENDTPMGSHGTYLEYFSPSFLIPAFHEKMLNRSLFKNTSRIKKLNEDTAPDWLDDNRLYSIVGCDTGLRGITHRNISMSQFLYAHCRNDSIHRDKLVPPFFYPPETPSGPDVVFVLESESQYYPVFMQSRISGSLESEDVKDAHQTTCFDRIKEHLLLPFSENETETNLPTTLADFCSRDIFVSLLFLPNHKQSHYLVAKRVDVTDGNKTLTQHTIIMDKNNISSMVSQELIDILEISQNSLRSNEDNGESSSGLKKRSVPTKSGKTRTTNAKKVTKPGRSENRRVSTRSTDAAQVTEDIEEVSRPGRSRKRQAMGSEREVSKPWVSNKRRAVEPIQTTDED